VHGYWLLMRLRRLFPDIAAAPRIDALFEEMLTPGNVQGELDYLDRAYSGGFSRPYGWAWLLALHLEAKRGGVYGEVLAPLAARFAELFRSYLRRLTYPIRVGTHFNTAFAMILVLEWTEANAAEVDEEGIDLGDLIHHRAADYFGADRDCQAWEPGGDEFLSSALVEALLMSRVGRGDAFLEAFLPRLRQGEPTSLFTPAFVSDRSDGKIAHLDGLNLSRAWCWRGLARVCDPALADLAERAAEAHLDASLPHVAGDYMGEHWLATYALLALEEGG
jgi:hypothetical protein